MNFQKVVLDNGLTVIGEYNNDSKSVSMGFFVRTGSRDETLEESGVSHFLEHMLFKGSDKMSALQINQEFDDIGADYNAYTSNENTVYYSTILPEYQDRLLNILVNMLQPSLRQEDFDMEKNVILEEIEMSKDKPSRIATRALEDIYFNGHPLGQIVLGTTESIKALSRDQMYEYYKRRYSTKNMIFAISGNYQWDKLIAELAKTTKNWFSSDAPRFYPPFEGKKVSKEIDSQRFEQVNIVSIAPGFAIQDELSTAATILATIIGDTDNSRLYWALVANGLAEAAYMGHDDCDRLGSFRGRAITNTENAEKVKEIFEKTLLEIDQNPITEQELERTKRKLAVSLVTKTTIPSERLFYLAEEYLYTNKYVSLNQLIDKIKAVSLADIDKILAHKPFEKLSMVILK